MANDSSIAVEYGRLPRKNSALFHFLCEGHDNLCVVQTLKSDPPLLRILIAAGRLSEWQALKAEAEATLEFTALTAAAVETLLKEMQQ
jgi:hypothetical protein